MFTKKPPLVITDLDGTLVNIMDEVLHLLHARFGVPLEPGDCLKYDVAESFYPLLEKHFPDAAQLGAYLQTFCWTNPQCYADARPYWDLHQALRVGMESGAFSVHVLTGRPATPAIRTTTIDWLRRWRYGEAVCTFAAELAGGKVEALTEILKQHVENSDVHSEPAPVLLIEDDLEVAMQLKAAHPVLQVYLPTRPWVFKEEVLAAPVRLNREVVAHLRMLNARHCMRQRGDKEGRA